MAITFRRGTPACVPSVPNSEGQTHGSAPSNNVRVVQMRIKRLLMQAFINLRHITGDDAYERYVLHHRQHHVDEVMLDRRAYYLAEQQRKWTGVKRCC